MDKRWIILTIILSIGLVSAAAYTPDASTEVNSTLLDNYVPDVSTAINQTLGPKEGPAPSGDCNPTINVNWEITDAQVCTGQVANVGTGSIIIETGGTLTLIGGSNVSAVGLELETTGDQVFIDQGSEIRIK